MSEFSVLFREQGFHIEEEVIGNEIVSLAKTALVRAVKEEGALRRSRTEEVDDPLQVVCCPYYDDVFLMLLSGRILDRIDQILGPASIIYSYNNSSMSPMSGNFSSRVHRERNYDTGTYVEAMGVLVLLDDFTENNGATWFLPGSHLLDTAPSKRFFYENAVRLLAPAGSVFYFHPRLFHAGGFNASGSFRDALSIGFCRAYMKQRLDLPSILAHRLDRISDKRILQKIGCYSIPPRTLPEFYQNTSGWE